MPRFAFALATALVALAAAASALSQSVPAAVDDLRQSDVTFEEGALTQRDLDELDEVAGELNRDEVTYKVVVLAEPVSDFRSADAFAGAVLEGLGGEGRILVFAPDEVGLASDVDPATEVAAAKRAGAERATATNSFAAGLEAAAGELGEAEAGSPGDVGGSGTDDGGGFPWAWLFVILVPLGLLLLVWRSMRKGRAVEEHASTIGFGEAEKKVRAAVDRAANGLLELSGRADTPDAAPEAKAAFERGADLFSSAQDQLEEADTRGELEAVYPTIVEAGWELDTARAILDGTPKPEQPVAEELFPAAAPAPGPGPLPPSQPVPEPEPHYRGMGMSPWLTSTAMAAITMLASRRGGSQPQYRQPMDDSIFDGWQFPSGGQRGGRSRGSSGRPRINYGSRSSGRGMGRRR